MTQPTRRTAPTRPASAPVSRPAPASGPSSPASADTARTDPAKDELASTSSDSTGDEKQRSGDPERDRASEVLRRAEEAAKRAEKAAQEARDAAIEQVSKGLDDMKEFFQNQLLQNHGIAGGSGLDPNSPINGGEFEAIGLIRADVDKDFEDGELVTGLSTEQMVSLWKAGALRKREKKDK